MADDFIEQMKKAAGISSPSSVKDEGYVPRVLDDEFAKLGYSPTARLSILGDVGRENAWNPDIIFKGHNDPKNKARNRGIISWQGDRQTKLNQYLQQEGVYGKADESELRAMARFMDKEMRDSYPDIHERVTKAQKTYDASKALQQYIKYDADPNHGYNSPDKDFYVKNNADYARKAQKLGLAQGGTTSEPDPAAEMARLFGPKTKGGTTPPVNPTGAKLPSNVDQPQTPQPIDLDPNFTPRQMKPGESGYSFETTGRVSDDMRYSGIVNGQYTATNRDGDQFVLDEQTKTWKPAGTLKKIRDANKNEYQLAEDQNGVTGGTRYKMGDASYIVTPEGQIQREGAEELVKTLTDKTAPKTKLNPKLQRQYDADRKRYRLPDTEALRQKAVAAEPQLASGQQQSIFTPSDEGILGAAVENAPDTATGVQQLAAAKPAPPQTAVKTSIPGFAPGANSGWLRGLGYETPTTTNDTRSLPRVILPPHSGKYLYHLLTDAVLKTDNGSSIKNVTNDPAFGVAPDNGMLRYADENGQTYLVNPQTGDLQDESLAQVAFQAKVKLASPGLAPTDAKNAYVQQVAQQMAGAYGISAQDAAEWIQKKGLVDFQTKREKDPNDFYARPGGGLNIGNPAMQAAGLPRSPESQDDTDTYSLTARDVNDLVSYAQEKHEDRKRGALDLISKGRLDPSNAQAIASLGLDPSEFTAQSPETAGNVDPRVHAAIEHGKQAVQNRTRVAKTFTVQGWDEYPAQVAAMGALNQMPRAQAAAEVAAYDQRKADIQNRYTLTPFSSGITGTGRSAAMAGGLDALETPDALQQRRDYWTQRGLQDDLRKYGSYVKANEADAAAKAEEEARKERLRKAGWGEYAKNLAWNYSPIGLSKAALKSWADVLKGMPVWTKPVADYIDRTFGTHSERIKDNLMYQFGDWFDKAVDSALPTNPDYDKDFWAGSVPQGAGSSIGMIPMAVGGSIPLALWSTMQMAGGDYDQATGDAGPEDEAQSFARWHSGLLGWTENLGLGTTWERLLEGAAPTTWRKMLADAVKEGLEETLLNEGPQDIGENLIARLTYDPNRSWDKGVAEQVAAAGISAPLISALTSGLLHIKNRANIRAVLKQYAANGGPNVVDFGEGGLYIYGKQVPVTPELEPLLLQFRDRNQAIRDGFDRIDGFKQRAQAMPEASDRLREFRTIRFLQENQHRLFAEQQQASDALIQAAGVPLPTVLEQKEQADEARAIAATQDQQVSPEQAAQIAEAGNLPAADQQAAINEALSQPAAPVGQETVLPSDEGTQSEAQITDTEGVTDVPQGVAAPVEPGIMTPETPAGETSPVAPNSTQNVEAAGNNVSDLPTSETQKPHPHALVLDENGKPQKTEKPDLKAVETAQNKSVPKYSNVQLQLTRDEAAPVKAFQQTIAKGDLAAPEDLPSYMQGKGNFPQSHVTVKYGLKTSDPEDVRSLFEGSEPVTLTLGKTAVFPGAEGGNYDVLIAEVDSPDLNALHKTITDNADVAPSTHPEYKPHVTIAYLKKGAGEKYADRDDFAGTKLVYDGVTFSAADKSKGDKTFLPLGYQMPIPKNYTPAEKAIEVEKLTKQNKPLVKRILHRIETDLGLTHAKDNEKTGQSIVEKATRPSILAKKPYHSVEHLRDTYRFRSAINSFSDLPRIAKAIQDEGLKIIKVDTSKMFEPDIWGWSMVALDMQAPNGQLLEFYTSFAGVLDLNTNQNHALYEKWRNKTAEDIAANVDEFEADLRKSFDSYQAAFDQAIEEAGYESREDAKASFAKAVASLSSATARNSLTSAIDKVEGDDQTPSEEREKVEPSATTKADLSDASRDTAAVGEAITNPSVPQESKHQLTAAEKKRIADIDKELVGLSGAFTTAVDAGAGGGPIMAEMKKLREEKEAILSPDVTEVQSPEVEQQGKKDAAEQRRLDAAKKLAVGDRVTITGGKAATITGISPRGYVSYHIDNTPAGSAVSGVRADEVTLNKPDFAGTVSKEGIDALTPEQVDQVLGMFDGKAEDAAASLIRNGITSILDEEAKGGEEDPFNFDDVSFKSVLNQPAPEFKQHVYDNLLPRFKKALATLEETDPQALATAFIKKVKGSSSAETVLQLEPYMVKFFAEEVLSKPTNGSIKEGDTQDEANAGKSDRDGQNSDAAESSGDVSGANGGRKTRPGSNGTRSGGTRNGSSTSESGDNVDNEGGRSGELSGESSGSDSSTESGPRSGDRAGDGVPVHRVSDRDYIAPEGSLTREGSWKQAAKTNLDIIELVKKLEAEDRDATPEEQALLAKYTGWGASELANNIFSYYPRAGWEDLHARAKELFTEDEYKVARQTTQYAHYTSEPVIRGIWDAVKQLGFQHGTILEPGMGIGLFPIAAPKSLIQHSRYTGVEMDPLTARIAKKLLPDQAILHNDFVKQKLPLNHFDVAIGNPPFADIKITDDKEYKKHKFLLHDYFFAKSLDRVRPGGLLVFVTSKGTMDKQNDKARQYMAEKADLLGAIRMPQTAFKENAGTEVVTDVLFFRKRMEGEEPSEMAWTGLKPIELTTKGGYLGPQTVVQHINEYFVDHPEMVLGNHSLEGSMYRANEYTVEDNGKDIEEQFREAIKNLPAGVFAKQVKSHEIVQKTYERDWDPKAKKEGSLYVHDDGRLMIKEGGSGVELESIRKLTASEKKWLADYVGLRDALKQAQYDQLHAEDQTVELRPDRVTIAREHLQALSAETGKPATAAAEAMTAVGKDKRLQQFDAYAKKWGVTKAELIEAIKQESGTDFSSDIATDWEGSLAKLNASYDAFVKKHGNILSFTETERKKVDEDGNEVVQVSRRYKNEKLLAADIEGPLVWSLERITEDGKILKAPVLLERQIKPPAPPQIKTLSDALAVSLDQVGTLNFAHIRELMKPIQDMTEQEIQDGLGEAIFEDPSSGWQMADEYLSGYVIDKLEEAEAAAASDPRFERNVKALREVQPIPLPAERITVALGATWVPADVVTQYGQEELGIRGEVHYDALLNKWSVVGASGKGSQQRRDASKEWGTADRSPEELFESSLNGTPVKIYERVRREGGGYTEQLNAEATAQANEKMKEMRMRFRSWIFAEKDRAKAMTERYNRLMNNIAERKFDGSHLTLPGLSTKYKLYPHQKRAVWRQIQTGNTYLAHAVGAGKTLEMIVGAMEQKRLGLISKPMFIVPNHMLKQFAGEFLDAYPLGNIMVADEQNFHTDNRKRFVAQAALNDLDAVILTHSAFGLLQTKQENTRLVVEEMIADLQSAIDELDEDDRSQARTIKQIEKRIERIERRFYGRMGEGDNVVDFEDLGVDFLYVDEAHEFRKLDFATNRGNVKGISPEGSMRALDLLVKMRWLDRERPGRSAVLASGTAITNTLAELYSIQRFLDHRELMDSGLDHFDAWAKQFGEDVQEYEMNAAGNYEMVERFARFINMPELMKRVRKFMDVLTLHELGDLVKLPSIKGGKPEVVVVPASEEQDRYLKEDLAQRIKESRDWKPSKEEPGNPDPLINIITDGRLAAIDMRFIYPDLPNDPNSKLNAMIDNAIAKYKEFGDVEYTTKGEDKPDPIKGGIQLIFSAVGFGDQVAKNRGFDAKAWMMKRFTEAGIPAQEIAFISDYKSSSAKEGLMKELRNGAKKILIGTPKNMGTGLNVQKRIVAMHYLSPPWYPADVEQPDGRGVRQGNQNDEIEVYRYATKGTYDSTQWAMIARKSNAIDQAMRGGDIRSVEDVSETSQYALASALAAGDDRAIKLAELRGLVEKYERMRSAHDREQNTLAYDQRSVERSIEKYGRDKEKNEEAIKLVGENGVSSEQFQATVQGVTLGRAKELGDKSRADIGDAIKENWKKVVKSAKGKVVEAKGYVDAEVAKIQGKFPLTVEMYASATGIETQLHLHVGEIKLPMLDGKTPESGIDMVDSTGLATRIYNALNSFPDKIREIDREVRELKDKAKRIEAKIGQPFAYDNELYQAIQDAYQLQREMAGEGAEPSEELTPGDIEAIRNTFFAKKAMAAAVGRARGTQQFEDEPSLKSVIAFQGGPNKFAKEILARDPNGKEVYLTGTTTEMPTVPEGYEVIKEFPHGRHRNEKIGTGEGHAAYGHGHYFAGRQEVADYYRHALSNDAPLRTHWVNTDLGTYVYSQNEETGDYYYLDEDGDWVQKHADEAYYKDVWNLKFYDSIDGAEDAITKYEPKLAASLGFDEGTLIQTELKPDEDEYLLWDKPLREQSSKVQAGIAKILDVYQRFGTLEGRSFDPATIATMGEAYDRLANIFALNNGSRVADKAQVSIDLLEIGGIRGVKYLDGSSRSKREGSYNYVIFDPDDIEVQNTLHDKLSDDELSGDEQATAAEMRRLSSANTTLNEVVEKANILGNTGGLIQLSPASHELYRRTEEQLRFESGKLDLSKPEDAEDLFKAEFIGPRKATAMAKALRAKAQEAAKKGYGTKFRDVLTKHADALDASVKDHGSVILWVFKSAIPHEMFHDADFKGALSKVLDERHTDESKKILDAHPIVEKLYKNHFSKFADYRRLKGKDLRARLRAEIPPLLLDSSEEKLAEWGITPDDEADYMLSWFQGYADKNGADSLQHFDREELNVQEFLNQVRKTAEAAEGPSSEQQNGEPGAARGPDPGTEGDQSGGSTSSDEGSDSSRQEPSEDAGRYDPDAQEYFGLGKGEKWASLPNTMRRAGLDLDDIAYEVFGDRAATEQAVALINKHGIEGTINLLDEVGQLDVHHAMASFMIQRMLLNRAAELDATDPKEAENLRAYQREIGRKHVLNSIAAGRFTRAASVIPGTVEGVVFTFQKLIQNATNGTRTLSTEQWQQIEAMGRDLETKSAKLDAVVKENARLKRQAKRLQDELEGKGKKSRRRSSSIKNRKQLVAKVKEEKQAAVDKIRARLKERFGDPAEGEQSLKSGITVIQPGTPEYEAAIARLEQSKAEKGETPTAEKEARQKPYYETGVSNSGEVERFATKREALKRARELANERGETVYVDYRTEDEPLDSFAIEPRNRKSDEPVLKSALSDEDETFPLDDFAEVGAMMLTEGIAGDVPYLPEDFKAELLGEYGDAIAPHFDEIYKAAWEKRDEWLREMRKEEARERVRNNAKYGEDLTDEEVEEILGQRKETAAKRRAIEAIHKYASQGRAPKQNLTDMERIIAENAPDNATAVIAVIMHRDEGAAAIKQAFDELGITDPKKQRQVMRAADALLPQAKKRLTIEKESVANELLETQKDLAKIDQLRWESREDVRKAQRRIAEELRHIKKGELAYRYGQLMDVGSAMRSMMASFDLSGSMRQGGFLTIANLTDQKKAFVNEFRSLSKKSFGQIMQEVEDMPLFTLLQRAGVSFALAGKNEDAWDMAGEELFRGEELIEKIPLLGWLAAEGIVKPSERTYTSFLDTQRVVMGSIFFQELMNQGLTYQEHPEEFRKIADFINVATGRGTIPNAKFAKVLMNLPLFAPRYTLSRLQLLNMTLNPVAYYNMPPAARKIVAGNAVRFYGTTMLALSCVAAFGAAIGASVNWDDDDSDFLKVKIGNTYYDIFAGLQPEAKLIFKIVHSAIRTKFGTDNRISGEFGWDIANAVGRFLRGKLSPLSSLAVDKAMGSDYVGNKVELWGDAWYKPGKAIYSRLIPLTIGDAVDAYKLDGAIGVAKATPAAIFGLGVTTYKARPENPETEAEKLASKIASWDFKGTQREKDQQDAIADLTARSRKGENIDADLQKAKDAGFVDDKIEKNIRAAASKSYLIDKVENFDLQKLYEVMRVATPAEQVELLPLVNKKMKNADKDEKLTPALRSKLEAMGAHILGNVDMPDDVRKVFDRLDIKTPDVGESLTVAKGEPKTKLDTDQYEQFRKNTLGRAYSDIQELINDPDFKTATEEEQKRMIKRHIAKARAKEQKDLKRELKAVE